VKIVGAFVQNIARRPMTVPGRSALAEKAAVTIASFRDTVGRFQVGRIDKYSGNHVVGPWGTTLQEPA
jgi:hypothetical protein